MLDALISQKLLKGLGLTKMLSDVSLARGIRSLTTVALVALLLCGVASAQVIAASSYSGVTVIREQFLIQQNVTFAPGATVQIINTTVVTPGVTLIFQDPAEGQIMIQGDGMVTAEAARIVIEYASPANLKYPGSYIPVRGTPLTGQLAYTGVSQLYDAGCAANFPVQGSSANNFVTLTTPASCPRSATTTPTPHPATTSGPTMAPTTPGTTLSASLSPTASPTLAVSSTLMPSLAAVVRPSVIFVTGVCFVLLY
jgi:hypothetical protein